MCVDCKYFYIFFVSEWPRSFNFIISLPFFVSFGEVKETVTQKWWKAVSALNSVCRESITFDTCHLVFPA
jgi:hypothetical protein